MFVKLNTVIDWFENAFRRVSRDYETATLDCFT